MKTHYEQACMNSCFTVGANPANPPKNLDEALEMIDRSYDHPNRTQMKAAVYACFAKAFDRAMKESV